MVDGQGYVVSKPAKRGRAAQVGLIALIAQEQVFNLPMAFASMPAVFWWGYSLTAPRVTLLVYKNRSADPRDLHISTARWTSLVVAQRLS